MGGGWCFRSRIAVRNGAPGAAIPFRVGGVKESVIGGWYCGDRRCVVVARFDVVNGVKKICVCIKKVHVVVDVG